MPEVTKAEWDAAVGALPKRRDGDNSAYGEGWNDYAWELISEGALMEVLVAVARAREPTISEVVKQFDL